MVPVRDKGGGREQATLRFMLCWTRVQGKAEQFTEDGWYARILVVHVFICYRSPTNWCLEIVLVVQV